MTRSVWSQETGWTNDGPEGRMTVHAGRIAFEPEKGRGMTDKGTTRVYVQAHEENVADMLMCLPSVLRYQLNLHKEDHGPNEWEPIGAAGNTLNSAMWQARKRALTANGVIVLTVHLFNRDNDEIWTAPIFEFKV